MENRPTRRRRRKEARPEEIIEAAMQELAEKGIAGTTLGGIATRAGISRTTIYLYFDSKQDVLEALARATVERTIDEAAAHLSSAEVPFEHLFTKVIDTVYDRMVAGRATIILRALIAEGPDQAELVEFYHREILAKGQAMIARMIRFGVERGELPASALEIDPRLVVSPAIFAAIWGLVFEPVETLDIAKFKRDHIQVLLCGLLGADSRHLT